jgi:putative phosphoesterase
LAVLQELKKITANVVAVQGNMDSEQTRRELETKQVIEAGKFRIGLIHGYGPPKSLPDLVKQEFQNVHCIVFGHSHQAFSEWREGILFFNPGSPTDKIFAVTNSVGILEINDKITPKIIYL